MFHTIASSPLLQALSQWFSNLVCPEAATASHEVGRHHLGAVASSYVDYGRWPESARHQP
jgi:hypothetical protein